MRVKIFNIESKSKRGFEKGDMHVVITIESSTIVSPITIFEPVPMFFHMDSIRKFKSFLQNWNFVTIVVIIIGVTGRGNNKGENNY